MKQTYLSPTINISLMAHLNEPLLAASSSSGSKYDVTVDSSTAVPGGAKHENPDDIDAKPNNVWDDNE